MLTIEQANELIRHASIVFDNLFIKRLLVESRLFPVTEYIMIACLNSYEKFYNQLKMVYDKITPEEIVKNEKGKLFTEITPLHIFDIVMFPLFGRMVRISNDYHDDPMKESVEKFNEICFILEFWERLARKYYDNKLSVYDSGNKCQIASDESLKIIKNNMVSFNNIDELNYIKKVIARIEQLAFLDECESRMKINNHGSYYVNNDTFIVVKEIIRLYDGKKAQWPWSETKAISPYSNILIAYKIKGDVKCIFNDWGTLTTEPIDISKNIVEYCLLVKKNNKIKNLELDELKAFEDYCKSAHKELFVKFSKWTIKELLEAGVLVYNKNFDRFTNLVGITDKIDWSISENIKNNEMKRILKNDKSLFLVGNWIMRTNRKRKIMPTFFTREKVLNFKKIGSIYHDR